MKEAKKKSVNMTFQALYSYILNTNYRSLAGIIGVLVSLIGVVALVFGWETMSTGQRTLFILVALSFLVINPLSLAFKAWQQLKLSPSYKQPLDYTFGDDGITVEQGEAKQHIKWDKICRIMMTGKMLAIYTDRYHAFVIPLSELGDDKGKIITTVVQFTAGYYPRISSNLKVYLSGKN